MNVRIDLDIVTAERQGGDLFYLEGGASDGTQAAFYLPLAALGGVVPQVGQRLTLALSATPAAAPSLRERMQAPRSVATPPVTAARSQSAAPRQDASGSLLAGILGHTTTNTMSAALGERDVDDEMDALLGPPRRKGQGRQ